MMVPHQEEDHIAHGRRLGDIQIVPRRQVEIDRYGFRESPWPALGDGPEFRELGQGLEESQNDGQDENRFQ